MDSLPDNAAGAGPLAALSRFRADFHACLTARADELCELADAVLCADGPVRDLAGLSLAAEHRRGHQLRLARPLAADPRLPWQRPCPPGQLTPARVRRDFRNIRATAGCPPVRRNPASPAPGRPPGSKNRHPALTLTERRERAG